MIIYPLNLFGVPQMQTAKEISKALDCAKIMTIVQKVSISYCLYLFSTFSRQENFPLVKRLLSISVYIETGLKIG